MKSGILATPVLAAAVGVLVVVLGAKTPPTEPQPGMPTAVEQSYAKLPLAFEPNRGQAQSSVGYLAHGAGYALMLRPTEAVFALGNGGRLRMRLAGGNAQTRLQARDRLPGKVNYLVGNDRSHWLRGIETYARVAAAAVYPGIDLSYHGNQGRLEYDFHVRPGADPGRISLAFEGADKRRIDHSGSLVLELQGGTLRQLQPRVYQRIDGRRRPVAGRFVLERNRVGFAFGDYDRSRTLVIDPELVYSTYLGTAGDDIGTSIAVDSAGSAYVGGYTVAGLQPAPRSPDRPTLGGGDAFVMKLNASGNTLIYSTFLGGTASDKGLAIGLDGSGSAYLTGSTDSTDFPTTAGAFDTSDHPGRDAFVAKLDSTGSGLAYSTYLGGNGSDFGSGIHADGATGSATVSGSTLSTDLPTTTAAYDTSPNGSNDAFVTRLNAAGGAPLVFLTYLGGSGNDYAQGLDVDDAGAAYVTGRTESANFPTTPGTWDTSLGGVTDTFVAKLGSTGGTLAYSTYLGGGGEDYGFGIAVDAAAKTAYLTGQTGSNPFPTTPGAYDTSFGGVADAFATKINSAGNGLVYSTYLGGTNNDRGSAIAVDTGGLAHVTGETFSTNFPTVSPAQGANAGATDAFVSKFGADGDSLAASTYLGGSGDDFGYGIAVDGNDATYVTGQTFSSNFPTLNAAQPANAGGADAFATKLAIPTAAMLRSLSARRVGNVTVLRWETGSEVGLLGFNVFGDRRGLRVRLNRSLVPAAGDAGGRAYMFRTSTRPAGYWLQEVGVDGSRAWRGPVKVN